MAADGNSDAFVENKIDDGQKQSTYSYGFCCCVIWWKKKRVRYGLTCRVLCLLILSNGYLIFNVKQQ